MKRSLMIIGITLIATPAVLLALPWPIYPDSSEHVVSYFFGGWQGMWREGIGNVNYFHVGIDIPADEITHVIAMESGYVKAVITIFDSEYHWRIIIADSAGDAECEGWFYAHIIPQSITVEVGDHVNAGDTLGLITSWPYPNTPIHLHLSRIKYSGDSAAWADGFWDYEFIANPLNYIDDVTDSDMPGFDNAWHDQLLAFCQDELAVYFSVGQPLSGNVDIVCRAFDYCGYYDYKTTVYNLEYKIEGDSSIPWSLAHEFSGSLDSYDGDMETFSNNTFKNDIFLNCADSMANYYIITNSDGDSIFEVDDNQYCWPTALFHNGEYTISVRVSDFVGNSTIDSMIVTVANYFELSGQISLSGIDSVQGTQVIVIPDSQSTTTDETGQFILPAVGGGSQGITFSRPGYDQIDTAVIMNQDYQFDLTLTLAEFICGDANYNGAINILDISYLIEFLYLDGPGPVPFESGDANGNSAVNILDITFLIAYLYQGGPAPDNCFGI